MYSIYIHIYTYYVQYIYTHTHIYGYMPCMHTNDLNSKTQAGHKRSASALPRDVCSCCSSMRVRLCACCGGCCCRPHLVEALISH